MERDHVQIWEGSLTKLEADRSNLEGPLSKFGSRPFKMSNARFKHWAVTFHN
jgi:hypothetical protein